MDRQDSAVALITEDKVSHRTHESHKKHDYMVASVREKELRILSMKDELREATIDAATVATKLQESYSNKVTHRSIMF